MKTFKNIAFKTSAVIGSSLASVTVFAADYSAEIGQATTDSTANVGLVITGVIGVAALGFGAGLLVKWLSR